MVTARRHAVRLAIEGQLGLVRHVKPDVRLRLAEHDNALVARGDRLDQRRVLDHLWATLPRLLNGPVEIRVARHGVPRKGDDAVEAVE